MLIDVHAHLHFPQIKEDMENILDRAKKNNFTAILNSGTSLESNKITLELSKRYYLIKPSLGIYPTEVSDIKKEINFIEDHKKEVYAIGEVGLDFKEAQNFEEQKKNFLEIIDLAERIKKPILIHSRKAEKEILDLLETSSLKKVILHCFSGNLKLVKRASDLNYYFSIPPVIVRLEHFKNVVRILSTTKLLTESDAPFLSPYKGQFNEPSFIKETIKEISNIKKLNEEEVEKIIFMNFQKIFC